MGPRRVDLAHEFGKARLRRWRTGILNHHTERHIEFGQLADDRGWYARHSGEGAAYVHDSERDARAQVDGWLSAGEWVEVPAQFGPDGRPVEDGWEPHGQTWRRVNLPPGTASC